VLRLESGHDHAPNPSQARQPSVRKDSRRSLRLCHLPVITRGSDSQDNSLLFLTDLRAWSFVTHRHILPDATPRSPLVSRQQPSDRRIRGGGATPAAVLVALLHQNRVPLRKRPEPSPTVCRRPTANIGDRSDRDRICPSRTRVRARSKMDGSQCESRLERPLWRRQVRVAPLSDRGREIADARWRRRGWICVQAVTRGTQSIGPPGMLRVVRDPLERATVSRSPATPPIAGCTDLAGRSMCAPLLSRALRVDRSSSSEPRPGVAKGREVAVATRQPLRLDADPDRPVHRDRVAVHLPADDQGNELRCPTVRTTASAELRSQSTSVAGCVWWRLVGDEPVGADQPQ